MNINNFFYIDKQINYTSFDIIRVLRKKFNIKKMGHTGTLDPLATGGLLVVTGNYTKLIPYLEKDTKEYEFDIMLDGTTQSFDLGEEVNYLSKQEQNKFKKILKQEDIQKLLIKNFSGKIMQLPPKYSALKINGKKAYELARQGLDIDLKAREVEIFNIEIVTFNYPKLSVKAKVSAGTYIRSIAADFGKLIGTGGYISKLRRTKIGNFDISNAHNLDNITINDNLDVKNIFNTELFINLEEAILQKINNGLAIKKKFNFPINKDLFVYNGEIITNIVKYDGEFLKAVKKI